LAGFAAIIMWSLLALFTARSGTVPPFQLLAMTFAIGSGVGLASWVFKRPLATTFRQPAKVWIVGIAGLFGYHFFYYTALRNAPAAEAGLIAYLWPLLIVLFSALLPNEKLKWFHLAGAVLGFGGTFILLLSRDNAVENSQTSILGFGAAFLCAFIWSGYSVLSRSFKNVPTDIVVIYCIVTAVLALLCHLALEQTVWPASNTEWLAVLALGFLPVGLAFYAWDYAMKHGPIQLLGSAAYLAPVISTIILVLAGIADMRWQLVAATLLVTLGAILASGKLTKGI
jgi:drug/metabolite transporter (DMT)-like permease